jgi:hypothetical protein
VVWAEGVSGACIRHKGDVADASLIQATVEAERSRFVSWWWSDDGTSFGLQTQLPAACGPVVLRTLHRTAEGLPVMPGDDASPTARLADALVALCSARLAQDADAERATVVVHAPLSALVADAGGCELEDGGVIHPETARRLGCAGRIQTVIEDENGQPLAMGRVKREPSFAMVRQLRYRDRECRFPGCGARRFTQAHHIVWWTHGGTTDLSNLVLVCTFHHKLVHEHGWGLRREPNGEVGWFGPDGTPYQAGPGPPREALAGA